MKTIKKILLIIILPFWFIAKMLIAIWKALDKEIK
jgi:hypothetical protein